MLNKREFIKKSLLAPIFGLFAFKSLGKASEGGLQNLEKIDFEYYISLYQVRFDKRWILVKKNPQLLSKNDNLNLIIGDFLKNVKMIDGNEYILMAYKNGKFVKKVIFL